MVVELVLKIAIGLVSLCFGAVMIMDMTGHRPRILWLQNESMIGPVSILAMIPMMVILTAGAMPQLEWSMTTKLGMMLWFLVMWLLFTLTILPFDRPANLVEPQREVKSTS